MLIKKLTIVFSLIFLATFFVSGCGEKVETPDDALSLLETKVVSEQHVELTKEAILEIRLEDVSKKDIESEVISTASRTVRSRPPYSLQIAFPTKLIKANHSYSLSASIRIDGELHFISTTHINPFAIGIASPITINVEKVVGKK